MHLNDLGPLAMAYAILKGLGAGPMVSEATLDASDGTVVLAEQCEITGVELGPDTLAFTRLDRGLPFNYALFYAFNYLYIPMGEINGYRLGVRGLSPGRYSVSADGVVIGDYSAEALARGVDLASATSNAWHPGSPWSVQGHLLKLATDARSEAETAARLAGFYLSESDFPDSIQPQARDANEAIIALQRRIAQPRPYRFRIEPGKSKDTAR